MSIEYHAVYSWHGDCNSKQRGMGMIETRQVDGTMNQRDANLLCLRDTLEHLTVNQQRLEWTEDSDSIHLLTESMIRDLLRCQRLCENLQRRCRVEQMV